MDFPKLVIGVPKEIKDNEFRVGMTPAAVAELVHHGHEVIVETAAGIGSGSPRHGRTSVSRSPSLTASNAPQCVRCTVMPSSVSRPAKHIQEIFRQTTHATCTHTAPLHPPELAPARSQSSISALPHTLHAIPPAHGDHVADGPVSRIGPPVLGWNCTVMNIRDAGTASA